MYFNKYIISIAGFGVLIGVIFVIIALKQFLYHGDILYQQNQEVLEEYPDLSFDEEIEKKVSRIYEPKFMGSASWSRFVAFDDSTKYSINADPLDNFNLEDVIRTGSIVRKKAKTDTIRIQNDSVLYSFIVK